LRKIEYQICSRCIIDTTVPGARFDNKGECSYCGLHDKLDELHPLDRNGSERLNALVENIKRKGKNSKYDVVLGVSGGRDSTYTLYVAKAKFGLRPLAVHFNDGFGNPIAGENMKKATDKLNVDLMTITSDWRESKDLKIAFLKSSTPELEQGTDLGIASSLYGAAAKENIHYILFGQSFRTEGIAPLEWNYLDGRYLKDVHNKHGAVKLRKWRPYDPGFNLSMFHMFYYTVMKRIRTIPILYHMNYVRTEAEEVIKNELDWVNTGAHYYDDLYQSLMSYVYRVKFNIDRRKINYSALIRSGQMKRDKALERVSEVYAIEDPKVIDLCIKRLGITKKEFNEYLSLPLKTFRDYKTHYKFMKIMKLPVKILSEIHLLPTTTYSKYFECG
jgi:N-acetyl sugar amidotransferase